MWKFRWWLAEQIELAAEWIAERLRTSRKTRAREALNKGGA